jgi:hypothetical protein
MAYTRPQLRRLEPIDRIEYRLLCYLRKQRRRALSQGLCFEVIIQGNKLNCRRRRLSDKRT